MRLLTEIIHEVPWFIWALGIIAIVFAGTGGEWLTAEAF